MSQSDYYIQILGEFECAGQAKEAMHQMRQQDGFVGGRILPPSPSEPKYRVQTFHDAAGVAVGDVLPEGCRLVLVPPRIRRMLGLPRFSDAE